MTGWDTLHTQARFRPRYPSEAVVRFLTQWFPGEGALLDVGCGAGRHTLVAASEGHRVVALDTSTEGLKWLWTRCLLEIRPPQRVAVVQGTSTALPFPDATFDGAIAYGVLYYGTAATFAAAVEELWRVLRPGGRALIVTRTPEDHRLGLGTRVAPCTTLLDGRAGAEAGMTMYFLPRGAIGPVFGRFAATVVGQQMSLPPLAGEERHRVNDDWLIEVQK